MKKCISILGIIPMRKEPDERSEMTNQFLFGELAEIREISGSWSKIQLIHDNYTGWVDSKMITVIPDTEFNLFRNNPSHILKEKYLELLLEDQSKMIIHKGSILYIKNDSNAFMISKKRFTFNVPVNRSKNNPSEESVLSEAKDYLNTPYLWGGRTPVGTDCSGFTQMIYKLHEIMIPRDVSEQIKTGDLIPSVHDAKTGDLAFFTNNKDKLTHVGIMISKNEIIHASGKVKIDKIDKNGIVKPGTEKYSHFLYEIKRILK